MRSAHRPPHQSRSSGVAYVQVDVETVTSARPACPGPGVHPAAGVGLAAVAAGHLLVQRQPVVEDREGRVPDHGAVVRVAGGDQAAGLGDPVHLAQRQDRVAEVLEHLVGVHHAERVIRVVERVDVAGREVEVLAAGRQLPGLLDDVRRGVDAGHVPVRHVAGQARGDRAGTAADVEDPHVRLELRQQVGGGVLGGAPPVRAQHRLMMTVCVDLWHAVQRSLRLTG